MFYVYLHVRGDTGTPFYVGKGYRNRYMQRDRKNLQWKHIVNKHGFDTIFLERNLTESKAFELEMYWINRIGRLIDNSGPLVNITIGGDGCTGRSWNGSRSGIQNPMYGKIQTEETKKKISDSKKGKARPAHVQEILRNAGKGKIGKLSNRFGTTHSESAKEKMRNAWQKRKQNNIKENDGNIK
jgi:hypothetical protein